ncbi:hypothetical protein ACPOL_4638 [Acidisarcina polymorpha]|uniref:Alpha-L-rhamnosidase six-hairpin glycosidase domain-containing protein n=2 Tax=Acidisarcina polymorpha TaxID=2211140 RepID=A0A2Z5G4L6_9BACT|nr:hypothetical protein ACPOL_4638 [Acidisarcina polymorpha]
MLLPAGLSLRIGIQDSKGVAGEVFLADALIGRRGQKSEEVFLGPHSWDGSYTDLRPNWHGVKVRVQSAHDGDDLVMLVTQLQEAPTGHPVSIVVFSAAYSWNRPGSISRLSDRIDANGPQLKVSIYPIVYEVPGVNIAVIGPYFAASLNAPAGISTGRQRSLAETTRIVERQRAAYMQSITAAGHCAIFDAIETTIACDTIYEPERRRVVSPVSRVWGDNWGGYVLFDWDTFFAAILAAVGNKDLAYANTVEILRHTAPSGFVPNFARAGDWKSFDRSEPLVGAITVFGLYRR